MANNTANIGFSLKGALLNTFSTKLTFWKVVGLIIVAVGLYSLYIRFVEGLGEVSNLTDAWPWGLWIGMDVVSGVGLAAGGFTICAVAHIFNIHRFEALTKPAILTAFLGYVLVVVALMIDLGRPYNIWRPLFEGNFHSVLFEVAMCVMTYTTVLLFEFSSVALKKFKDHKILGKIYFIVNKLIIPLVILGVVLSTLHQSSLGSLYLIVPTKMHPLWWSPYLPVFFYLSAIAVGFSMVTFEGYLSARAFNHGIKRNLITEIMRISAVVLGLTFILKFVDLAMADKLPLLVKPVSETAMFWLEVAIGTVIPIVIMSNKKLAHDRFWLFMASVSVVGGFLLNRMNVSITSLVRSSNGSYFPSFTEISITMMLVVIAIWVFTFIVRNFPVFEEHVDHDHPEESPVAASTENAGKGN